MENRVFVTCPHGLEDVTAKEIKNITGIHSAISVGGVSIVCSLQQIYELNYTLRTATHVLQEICNFKSTNITLSFIFEINDLPFFELKNSNPNL